MSWEVVCGRGAGAPMEKLPDEQVSLVSSSANGKPRLRLNCHKKLFPEGTRSVKLMVDKEHQRIGLFKLPDDQLDQGKALCTFGKSNVAFVYVTLPPWITDIGFTRGRYKWTKKEENKDMYFMVSLKNKIKIVKEEESAKTA